MRIYQRVNANWRTIDPLLAKIKGAPGPPRPDAPYASLIAADQAL